MMKKRRKWSGERIFGVLFIVFLFGFSVSNWYLYGGKVEKEIREEAEQVWRQEEDIGGAVAEIEETVNEELLLRYPMVEAYGLLQMAMGKKEENGFDYVKDKRGFLHSGNFWSGFGDEQKELAVRTRRFFDRLEASGIKTGFVLWPMKTAEPQDQYYGIPYNDFTKLSASMAAWLRYYGIPLLDLRNLKEETGMSQEEFFFKTDHHWTPPAAFEGYLRLLDWMEETYGEDFDPTGNLHNRGNYKWDIYEDVMLGSAGRDAGILFSGGLEDYTVVYPREEGEYILKTGRLEDYEIQEGSFQEALLNLDLKPEKYSELYEQKAARTYLGDISDQYVSIENCRTDLDRKILLLRDSFSQPVGAFLAQSFKQVDMLWIVDITEDELEAFLEENQYDYILMALYPENLKSDAFPFEMEEP